jgi:hypothetical protein
MVDPRLYLDLYAIAEDFFVGVEGQASIGP